MYYGIVLDCFFLYNDVRKINKRGDFINFTIKQESCISSFQNDCQSGILIIYIRNA